jgi:hypothetical protein
MKFGLLLRILLKDPREFRDRLLTIAEFQTDRLRRPATTATLGPDILVRELGERIGAKLDDFLQEGPLREIENRVGDAQAGLLRPAFGPPAFHNARLGLARLCYAVCRAQQPEVVLETGVGYGVTSAFFLQALAVNGRGQLWSIDLPPLGKDADAQSGILVPKDLKSRWHFLRGRSRHLLPKVISGLPAIDIFLHDSLHTYRNMSFEFRTVWPALRDGGVLLSDDVAMNRAFERFSADSSIAFAAVDGAAFFGVAVKAPAAT